MVVRTGFSITLRDEELRKALEMAPARLASELKRGLVNIGAEFSKRHKARQFKPYRDAPYASVLRTRSGRTRGSTKFFVRGRRLGELKLTIVNSAGPGNVAQEEGGTFYPTGRGRSRGHFLAFPTRFAMTGRGNLRGPMQIVKKGERYFTAAGHRTFFLEKNGRKMIAFREKSGRVRAIRHLRRRVTLPGDAPGSVGRSRMGYGRTWDNMAGVKARELENAARRTLKAIGKEIT